MKIKLGIFFGGKSVEHEVSIITAIQAMENIDKDKYDVIPIYISKENKMYTGKYVGDIKQYKNIENLLKISKQITIAQKGNKVALINCNKKIYEKQVLNYIDVAFPIVHGTNVEDGTIQGYLKMFNIPYVGSDVISSACGMDKYVCKCILKESKLPVIDCICYTIKDYNERLNYIISQVEEQIKYPVIVKPANLGSSVGIGTAKNQEELKEKISTAFTYSQKIIIEKQIVNMREINCSVIGDIEETRVSECEEPMKTDDILSYKDKYISGKKGNSKIANNKIMNAVGLKLPADIDINVKNEIEELSKRTFEILGCSGVIRIDFIIEQNSNKIYINEVNTIPGSLAFHLWREIGVEYTQLLDMLIEISLKRYRAENELIYSIESNILSGISLEGIKTNNK